MVRALSIQQPWAWLIVNGYKTIENRTWHTEYLGELYIHAGKKFDQAGYDWVRFNFPDIRLPEVGAFERGGFVGKVDMVGCGTKRQTGDNPWHQEGCWGFIFENPQPVAFVPWRGMLGLFTVIF